MTFDDEMRAVAKELLDEFGFAGVLTRYGSSELNTTTLRVEDSSPITIPVVAAFTEPPDARQYETQMSEEQKTERKWFIIQPTGAGEPLAGDTLTAEGRDLLVEGINPIGPKKDAIYYRGYAER